MSGFNLSEWALRNRTIVLYAILMLGLLGAWSYKHLGQSEDPPLELITSQRSSALR